MCLRYHLCQYKVRRVATAFSVLLVFLTCNVSQSSVAQQWDGHNGISSSDFLQLLPAASLPIDGSTHAFPQAVVENSRFHAEKLATRAAFEKASSAKQTDSVQSANFESSPITPITSIGSSATPVGTGVGSPTSTIPYDPQSFVPATASTAIPAVQNQGQTGWLSAFALNPNMPNYLVGFDVLAFRRSNDTVGPYTEGGNLGHFDREMSGRYTVSKLMGSIERMEFKFTGPFHWDRQLDSPGPVNSRLPMSFSSPFDNADQHRQSHSVHLSSYELNRCVTGDEFSKFFYGLRLIDYEERFELEATRASTKSLFGLRTHDLMAGAQIGMDINRPLSQRLNVGMGAATGLYGNFVKGALTSKSGSSTNAELNDDRLRLGMMLEMAGRVNYRLSQSVVASGGYEFWYFPALATAANQRLDYTSSVPTFSLRTGDDQLFRGWTVGLSARF